MGRTEVAFRIRLEVARNIWRRVQRKRHRCRRRPGNFVQMINNSYQLNILSITYQTIKKE